MKKLIALTFAILMVLGIFAGCADASPKFTPVKPGKLTVAISPDFAPMEFVDPSKEGQDKFVGFDVSLAKYLAKEMNLELEIMPMDFNACQTAVQMGTVDMSISGYSWTEERAENFNLSDYYYAGDNETEQVLITTAANKDKYATAESLKGLKVGAQAASLQASLCEKQLADTQLVIFGDLTTGLLQLKNGDFDVMAVAKGNADAIMANNKDIVLSGFEFEVSAAEENNLILLKKGADELTKTVNELLKKALDAGYYGTWYTEAEAIAGIEVSYDEDGNVATEPPAEGGTTAPAN